jgi:hypothetical protein
VEEALSILAPLAEALDYAHRRGVLHRDVKPSNIMFQDDGTPVLADFGLARVTGSLPPLTRTGEPLGTYEYMAPEIARGEEITASVDRYALAVIAYQMLTGEVPFTGAVAMAILIAHRDRQPPRPHEVNSAVSAEVEAVLLRALEKQAEDRYATAQDFVAGLTSAHAAIIAAGTQDNSLREARLDAGPSTATGSVAGGFGSSWRAYVLAEDMSMGVDSGSIGRLAVIEALQHPSAMLPLAVASLAAVYVALLAPVLGYGLLAAAVGIAGLTGAIAGTVRRYSHEYVRAAERLRDRRERERYDRGKEELSKLHQTLHDAFSGIDATEGLKTLALLTMEFQQLLPALERRESDPLSMVLVPALGIETYRQGLSALGEVFNLWTPAPTIDRLREDVAVLEKDVERLAADQSQAGLLEIRKASLEQRRDLLRRHSEQELRRERVLFAAQSCEATLHRTRIDIAEIRSGGSEASVDAVINALRRTIDQTREIQAEIRRQGY